jgi:excisionase family DNA binding protein
MKTLHLEPKIEEERQLSELSNEVSALLSEGKRVAVMIAEEDEILSPATAGQCLGFSRQHTVRLIEAGELRADRMPGSGYWKVPLSEVLAFEERRRRARDEADEFSRSLDEAGAPLE